MKLALPNLKTLDYKQLLINHAEKAVVAVIGLMIASVLYYSNWRGTEYTPADLIDKAEKSKQEIEARPWPATVERQKVGLGKGNQLSEKVVELLAPISASPYAIPPLCPPLYPDKTLISMPHWLPVEHLIADYGVAEVALKPGEQPLDDTTIRKPHKDRDQKNKGRRERKRREPKAATKEKKEESDDAIPAELKPKQGAGQTGFGGTGGIGGNGLKRRIDKGKSRDSTPNETAGPAEPAATPAQLKPGGRGYRFIAVRGIFPLRDQMAELARVMGLPSTQKELQGYVQIRDFKLERQTRIERSGADPWSGPWEPVDREPVIQLLENDVNGYAPETVLDGLLDPHICMPYPERIVGDWDRLATHPDVKEFTLSDDEVDKQVEYEWRLIEKVRKEDTKGQKPVDKGGFSALSKNMRALANRTQVMGGADERSLRDKVLAELEHGNGDKEQLNEQLAEFVRKSATAVDHYLLFRYLDIGDKDRIKPGATYRYRVKLVLANPFRDRRVEEVTDPSIIEGDERETQYSEPTVPVTVQEDAQFFVMRVNGRTGRATLPFADMDIFQWLPSTGTVVNKMLQIQIGQILGGRKSNVEVLRPAEDVFDKESVLFQTNDALVDVASAVTLDSTLHKDILDSLTASGAKRAFANAPEEAVVVDENGQLHVLDGIDQKPGYDTTKKHYEQQNKPFQGLKKANDEDDVLPNGNGRTRHHGKKGDPRKFGVDKGKY